jgi:hypothetical protein
MRLPGHVSAPGVVLAALLVALPAPCWAQTPDSAASVARDSSMPPAGYSDSASRQGVDTTRPASATDSNAKAREDSTHLAPTPVLPVDSVLGSACAGTRTGSLATGLLVVQFRTDAEASERQAALKEAGGTMAGPSPDGGQYVRAASESTSTRDVADLLALNPVVASVSERSCPAGR